MIYVVSGFMRTGTSVMVEALKAGGLSTLPALDHNHEVSIMTTLNVLLNPQTGDEKLLKCLSGGMPQLAAWDWKVVYMHRDYEEVRESCDKLFGPGPHICDKQKFVGLTRYVIGIMKQRRDIDLLEFQYKDLVREPFEVFELMKIRGWPIDSERAAKVIDPSKYRTRIENIGTIMEPWLTKRPSSSPKM